VRRSEDQFRRSIAPRADVGNVRLPLDQLLGGAKVADLHQIGLWIHQDVLGLDVPMTNLHVVNIEISPDNLVSVQLHEQAGDILILPEVAQV